MLDHVILGSFLGHVGGGKWPQDEAKTMPRAMYFYNTYYDNSAVYSKPLLKLFKKFRITQCYQVYHYKLPGSYQRGVDHTSLIPRPCNAAEHSFPGHVGGARKWPESEATTMNCQ